MHQDRHCRNPLQGKCWRKCTRSGEAKRVAPNISSLAYDTACESTTQDATHASTCPAKEGQAWSQGAWAAVGMLAASAFAPELEVGTASTLVPGCMRLLPGVRGLLGLCFITKPASPALAVGGAALPLLSSYVSEGFQSDARSGF